MKPKKALEQCIAKIINLTKDNQIIFIAVGGLSRSGKSTLINYILTQLTKNSISSTSINLDHWILPLADRNSAMTVKDRYQYSLITNDINTLLNKGEISFFPYESSTRSIFLEKTIISIKETQVVFFDGVIALDHPLTKIISALKIFVKIDEKTRKERFIEFYRKKGVSEKNIQNLYDQRMLDEYEFVMESGNKADFIISE